MFSVRIDCENRATMPTREELNRVAEIRYREIDVYRLATSTCSFVSPATNRNFFHGRATIAEPFRIIVFDAPDSRKDGVVNVSAAKGNGP
jgi:hypothetical protein